MSNYHKNRCIAILAAAFAMAMVIFPDITEEGSKTAIIIWANSIIPVLLPFFIFSEFIKNTGNLQSLPPGIYPFVMAFLSGYPMGAKAVGDFVREGRLTAEQGRFVLSYSLVTGPAFIIFTVGTFIGSREGALIVASAHYGGALLNSLLYMSEKGKMRSKGTVIPGGSSDYLESFSRAIGAGFKYMAMILAYLMFFTIGINLMEKAGLSAIIHNQAASACLKGIMEMTIGTNMVGLCDISMAYKVIMASALVSFGGLSVIGQSMSMTRGSGLGLREIISIKATHCIIAVILAALFVNIVVL